MSNMILCRSQIRDEINDMRWEFNVKRLDWVSGFFDQGTIFAETFGVVGILKPEFAPTTKKSNASPNLEETPSEGTERNHHHSFSSMQTFTFHPECSLLEINRKDGRMLLSDTFKHDFNGPALPVMLSSLTENWELRNMELKVHTVTTWKNWQFLDFNRFQTGHFEKQRW